MAVLLYYVGNCSGCWSIFRQKTSSERTLFVKPQYCKGLAGANTGVEKDKTGVREGGKSLPPP